MKYRAMKFIPVIFQVADVSPESFTGVSSSGFSCLPPSCTMKSIGYMTKEIFYANWLPGVNHSRREFNKSAADMAFFPAGCS
ncbi:Uncharacterised protein [Yersinia bercovieri]|nr:Uncharacterised protein [Yersinia bercovieri]CNI41964.1 Uncharacterised protein [Yersinia bercovieri]